MKVYVKRGRRDGLHTLSVAPAAEDPSVTVPEWWKIVDGERVPASVSVQFVHGEAVVPDNLGRFLVDKGYATKTRPLLAA